MWLLNFGSRDDIIKKLEGVHITIAGEMHNFMLIKADHRTFGIWWWKILKKTLIVQSTHASVVIKGSMC